MGVSKNRPWGVVIFPGANCDHDAIDAAGRMLGNPVRQIWHREADLKDSAAVILPGGFSYGDYLRSGAVARFAPAMDAVSRFASAGGIVIGVCNGFQVLTEAGLLPGVLLRNIGLRFICREVYLRVERDDTPFTSRLRVGQVLKIPIAHNEGNYFLPPDDLARLEENRQVVFRYCTRDGEVTPAANPNGAINNIAGVINLKGNVMGMMPHPERRCDPLLGRVDGADIFRSMNDYLRRN